MVRTPGRPKCSKWDARLTRPTEPSIARCCHDAACTALELRDRLVPGSPLGPLGHPPEDAFSEHPGRRHRRIACEDACLWTRGSTAIRLRFGSHSPATGGWGSETQRGLGV